MDMWKAVPCKVFTPERVKPPFSVAERGFHPFGGSICFPFAVADAATHPAGRGGWGGGGRVLCTLDPQQQATKTKNAPHENQPFLLLFLRRLGRPLGHSFFLFCAAGEKFENLVLFWWFWAGFVLS